MIDMPINFINLSGPKQNGHHFADSICRGHDMEEKFSASSALCEGHWWIAHMKGQQGKSFMFLCNQVSSDLRCHDLHVASS